jgi:hypothetical protein
MYLSLQFILSSRYFSAKGRTVRKGITVHRAFWNKLPLASFVWVTDLLWFFFCHLYRKEDRYHMDCKQQAAATKQRIWACYWMGTHLHSNNHETLNLAKKFFAKAT